MCFNKEISLTTFIVASIISILFYLRNKPNDRLIAIFNFSIGLMQLAEYFIWLNINNKEKNKFYTRIAKLIYSLHPIVILFAFYFLGSLNINKSILVYPIIFGLFGITPIITRSTDYIPLLRNIISFLGSFIAAYLIAQTTIGKTLNTEK